MYSIPDLIKKCTDTSALFHESKTAIDARIVSKLFAFYGTGRYITVSTTAQTQPNPHTSHSFSKTACHIIHQCTSKSKSLFGFVPQVLQPKFCMNIPSHCSTLKTRVTSVTLALLVLVTESR